MTNLKHTKTVSFKKEVSNETASTFAVINLDYGTNKRGEGYMSVNQLNTANAIVAMAAKRFEAGQLSLEEMIKSIESQGYSKR